MTVYVLATLLSCLFAWLVRGAKWPRIMSVLAALPLLAVSAMRWGIGTDFYFTYLPEFRALEWLRGGGGAELADRLFAPLVTLNKVAAWTCPQEVLDHFLRVLDKSEPGFRGLMETAVFTGIGFRLVVAVCAALSVGCVFLAIFRQTRHCTLAVLLFVLTSNYFLSLNIMRQYVAIGFLLIGVGFICEARFWTWVACVAAGTMFHYTAAVFMPLYLLRHLRVSPWWGFLSVAVTFVFSAVAEPSLLWLMPRIGLGYYCRYFGDTGWAKDGFETVFFAVNLCFMIGAAWYWKRATAANGHFRIWYWMTVLGTMALALSGTVPLMKRINFYFAAPQFLMLPEMLAAEENPKLRRLFTVLAILAFAAETYVAVWLLNKNEPLPYRWCWR